MAIEVTITNDEALTELAQLVERVASPRALYAAIAQQLATETELSFFDEGPGWPQLAASTVAARNGSAHPILQVSNALARSFTTDFGDNFAAIGSNDPKAVWHQFGTKPYTIKPKNKKALAWAGGTHPVTKVNHPGLPARPMLPIDESNRLRKSTVENLLDIARDYVSKNLI